MQDFTFLTTAYNQEYCIVDQLESIKKIIERYGEGIDVQYKLFDDGSSDNTAEVVKDWLRDHEGLFAKYEVFSQLQNSGTVHNLIDAYSSLETPYFKELGGDDTYRTVDIFSLCEKHTDEILLTPVTFVSEQEDIDLSQRQLDDNFKFLYDRFSRGKIGVTLRTVNYIQAPGAFFPTSFVQDKDYLQELQYFHYIEDYPSWLYWIVSQGKPIAMDFHSCVNYRQFFKKNYVKTEKYSRGLQEDVDTINSRYHIHGAELPKCLNFWLIQINFEKQRFLRKNKKLSIIR